MSALLAGALAAHLSSACPTLPGQDSDPVVVSMQSVQASQVVRFLFEDVWMGPFVTSPAVDADKDLISVRLDGRLDQVRGQLAGYLAALGFRVTVSNCLASVSLVPKPAAAVVRPPPLPPVFAMVYRPIYRPASVLAAALTSAFPSVRSGASQPAPDAAVASSGSSGGLSSPSGAGSGSTGSLAVSASTGSGTASPLDALVVTGTRSELDKISAVLPQLDTPERTVIVKAAVFEVAANANVTSPFQLALNLLQSRLSTASALSSAAAGGAFGVVTSSTIESVINSLSSDSRFRVVTAPTLRAVSGQSATFSVGSSVPTLGAVSYQSGYSSTPVQSVVYRDSGVIFTVQPDVRAGVVSLRIHQEVSNFVNTTTGLDQTPTLNQRQIDTVADVSNGDVIVLGGLSVDNATKGREGLFGLMFGADHSATRSDLVLVVQVVQDTASDDRFAAGLAPGAPVPSLPQFVPLGTEVR